MASILKSACIVLSVFLYISFSSAHRFFLDQSNDDQENIDPLHHEAVKNLKGEGVGVGYGTGSGSGECSGSGGGSGYGSGVVTGSGDGSCGSGTGKGVGSGGSCYGSGEGVGYGSGSAPGWVPGFTIPIPQIPAIPIIPTIAGILGLPRCVTGPCVEGGHTGGPIGNCSPGNNNGLPDPHYEHQKPGGSSTGTAKEMQEAINYIVSEPYPPVIDHNQP